MSDGPGKSKQRILKALVWHMRWMNRWLGFLTRPAIAAYAEREVIACGLRARDGTVRFIYSPGPHRGDHWFVKKISRSWTRTDATSTAPFSGDLVEQAYLSSAKLGEVYRVQAENEKGRVLHSPDIWIKKETIINPGVIRVESLKDGHAMLSWLQEKRPDSMIYFLSLEDGDGKALAGIYTVEKFWQYPMTRAASLTIGLGDPPRLETSGEYTAKLVVVDFNGWVSTLDQKTFRYAPA
jgi:hypothetical protein